MTMATRDVAAELGKSDAKPYVVGPVPDKETSKPRLSLRATALCRATCAELHGCPDVAQSLLDRHRNLASKPMDPALGGNVEQDEDRTHVIIHVGGHLHPSSWACSVVDTVLSVQNRIHGTGALTPASLAMELEAGIKMREAADTKSESTKAGGNGT